MLAVEAVDYRVILIHLHGRGLGGVRAGVRVGPGLSPELSVPAVAHSLKHFSSCQNAWKSGMMRPIIERLMDTNIVGKWRMPGR